MADDGEFKLSIEDRDLLIRLDEKVNNIQDSIKKLDEGMENLNKEQEEKYVTKDEFKLVRTIVFALVGTILLFVLNGILSGITFFP